MVSTEELFTHPFVGQQEGFENCESSQFVDRERNKPLPEEVLCPVQPLLLKKGSFVVYDYLTIH